MKFVFFWPFRSSVENSKWFNDLPLPSIVRITVILAGFLSKLLTLISLLMFSLLYNKFLSLIIFLKITKYLLTYSFIFSFFACNLVIVRKKTHSFNKTECPTFERYNRLSLKASTISLAYNITSVVLTGIELFLNSFI